jgi:hypothetical protein
MMLCLHVYNAAIGERREAWRMRGHALRPERVDKSRTPEFIRSPRLVLAHVWEGWPY